MERDLKKKKSILIIGIISLIIVLLGSTYAFFVYTRISDAFVLNLGDVRVTFAAGTNVVNFGNAYPISDEFAIANLGSLTYSDFTLSGEMPDSTQVIEYEIFLTENEGNTLSSDYVKLYLTDDNDVKVTEPLIYSNLENTSYTEAPLGKVVYLGNDTGSFSKNYRLYVWLDSTYEQNEVSQNFSFKINIYAYNAINENYVPEGSGDKFSTTLKAKLGTGGLIAINTDGALYDETDTTQTIREYRYAGMGNYCTYTDGTNDINLNVEGNTCPASACVMSTITTTIFTEGSDASLLFLEGGTCADAGGTTYTLKTPELQDSGLRNYVEFNGEMWRVLGIFGDNVKLIKDTPVENDAPYMYETATGGYLLNFGQQVPELQYGLFPFNYTYDASTDTATIEYMNWPESSIMHYLNDSFDLSYHSAKLSSTAKGMIQADTYYLGYAMESALGGVDTTLGSAYNDERNPETVDPGYQQSWTGNVGLLHFSDYLYSMHPALLAMNDIMSAFSSETSFLTSWLSNTDAVNYYFLTPSFIGLLQEEQQFGVWTQFTKLFWYAGESFPYGSLRPVVTLKSSVMVSGGDGSYSNPYKLSKGGSTYPTPLNLTNTVKSKVGTEGLIAIDTNGEVYEGSGTIREYRYAGSGNYCTYTVDGESINMVAEDNKCPNLYMIYSCNNDFLKLQEISCSQVAQENPEVIVYPDSPTPTDSGIRNYIEFNGETWRILGVFDENIKLVKDTPLLSSVYSGETYTSGDTTYTLYANAELPGAKYGYFAYNYVNSTYKNDWGTAGVMHYLNDETGNSYYVNNLSSAAKSLLVDSTYYLGASTGSDGSISTPMSLFNNERTLSLVPSGNSTTWTGKVGLLHFSDYLYTLGDTLDEMALYSTWIRNTDAYFEEFISPYDTGTENVWGVIVGLELSSTTVGAIRPVVTLKSDAMIIGGNGSYDDPYRLSYS